MKQVALLKSLTDLIRPVGSYNFVSLQKKKKLKFMQFCVFDMLIEIMSFKD
jgi:hypothetical protein